MYNEIKERISQSKKDFNDKQWYKDKIDSIDKFGMDNLFTHDGVNKNSKLKANYDIFNNKINKDLFKYVVKPFGISDVGELPADFMNRDIISPKIKVLLGMEMKMPFSWKLIAVNEEATTRKEQEEFNRIKQFVYSTITQPILKEIEVKHQAELQNKELSAEEKAKIQEQIQQELQAATPDEVKKYMQREHQDPAEVLGSQLLEYLILKEKLKYKFTVGYKHALIAANEIYYCGIVNNEPVVKVLNPIHFKCQKSSELEFIEDAEWASYEYRMTPSEIIKHFKLNNTQKDKLYDLYDDSLNMGEFDFNHVDTNISSNTIRVLHAVWKSLRKIQFLEYVDENGENQMKIVDENYKLSPEIGDIKLTVEWIPQVHEGWKIGFDIYPIDYLRPLLGQHIDLDTLYDVKLPYIGAYYDNLNSEATSAVDRIIGYQYLYDIICYRVELLMASDKGKILVANINAIPKSAGLSVDKFLYFMESNKIAFLNPNEEGNKNKTSSDITNMVKEIDMSLASNIKQYIDLAEYIEKRTGDTIGVSKQMEGQFQASDAVANTQQSLIQASYIVQPYFDLHNIIKSNVLTYLLELAKVAYSGKNKPRKLSYILDDLSLRQLDVDNELLSNSTYGLFISDSVKEMEVANTVKQLAHAAMQNQKADLSDVIKVLRSDTLQGAEELLIHAENKKTEEMQANQKATLEQQASNEEKQRVWEKEKMNLEHSNKMEEIQLKGDLDLQKQTILSVGFNENKDMDNDGTPDVLELAKHGVDTDIKNRKQTLEELKFQQKTKHDEEKLKLEKEKINKKAITN